MLRGVFMSRNRAAGRSRNRPGLTLAARLEREAIAAARRNNASLWYVRNDLSNVWQNSDASGAPALNAPIGYLGDAAMSSPATQATTANKPLLVRVPRKMGPELVVNGGFSTGAPWTLQSGAVVSGGTLTLTKSGPGLGEPSARQDLVLTSGRTYAVTLDYNMSAQASNGTIYMSAPSYRQVANSVSSGRMVWYYTAAPGDTGLNIRIGGGDPATGTATIDNISVREVLEWSYALQFDGSNDYLAGPGAETPAGETLIVAAAHTAVPPSAIRIPLGRRSGNTGTMIRVEANGTTNAYSMTGSAVASIEYSVSQSGVPSVWSVVSQTGNSRAFKGGTQVGSALTGTYTASTASTTVGIGAESGVAASAPMLGTVALACWAPVAMPDADRQAIERFGAYLIGAPYAA